MLIKLIRNKAQGNAIFGQLVVDNQLSFDTLEHLAYAIPTGFYRVRLTYSPKFKEILPILDSVIGRTGIRIHAGNTIQHTTGCVLVGTADQPQQRLLSSRKALNQLREYLLNYQKQQPNEEIYIDISEPDAYPLYDTPCERELQEHVLDARRAEQRYYKLHPEECKD